MHEMPEAFIMRPVMRGLISYTDLIQARVDLGDIVFLNHCLDVQDKNEEILQNHLKENR